MSEEQNNNEDENGVEIDLVSESRINSLRQEEKISLIVRGVQDGKIVILQKGLTPDEKSALIERTMEVIEPNGFKGIEIETFEGETSKSSDGSLVSRASSLLGSSKKEVADELTVIGPAKRLETLQKENDIMSTIIKQG